VGWNACKHVLLSFPLVILSLLQGAAHADVISGSVDLYEQTGDNKSTDATGLTSVSKTKSFLQRYNINYNNMIYPTINLWGRMRFEKQGTNSDTDGNSTKSTDTSLLPSVGITYMNSPFVVTGVSYDEWDEKQETGGSSLTTIRETKNAFLGLKPEGLPTLDLRYTGNRRFDSEHTTLDTEDNRYTLFSMYRPVKSLQLNYNADYDDNQNHLTLGETQATVQSGRVSYDDHFFDNRLVLNGNYNISRQVVESLAGSSGGGAVQVQLFPINGLSSISDTPVLNVLDVNQALIDGNLTASTGLNIGQLPSVTGDTRRRNAGLDFGVATEISTLFVWVDRTLPSVVYNSFVWEIYTSQDNQNWSLYQTVFPAPFGPFDNRFEISFPAVQTRYVKAVTRPLSVAVVPPPGVDVNNIFITELQAFNARTLSQAAGSTTTTVLAQDTIYVDGKLYIVRGERRSLLYDLYYQNLMTDQSGKPPARQSTLANALIGMERFSKVFSGSAKILVQNDDHADGKTLTYYDYEASLAAMVESLRKLHHNLVLTAKREVWDQLSLTQDSGILSLGNTGELYPGINLSLQGVGTLVSKAVGTTVLDSDTVLVSFGADVVPHRALTMAVNADWSEGHQHGIAASFGASVIRRQSTGASVAYNPLSSLYLFGSIQRVEETNKPTVTYKNISGSWSAQQRGGTLEIRLLYAENNEAESQTRDRSYGPYAKWKINVRTSIDASYMISTSYSPEQKTEAQTFNSNFKLYF